MPEFEKFKFGLVAIGSGNPAMAKNFKQDFNFPGEIFVDEGRAVYEKLGCHRGVKYVLNSKALGAIKAAMKEGYSQGKTQGDSLQLGGVFIISKTKGLLYQRLEEFAGDHPTAEEVKQACEEAVKLSTA